MGVPNGYRVQPRVETRDAPASLGGETYKDKVTTRGSCKAHQHKGGGVRSDFDAAAGGGATGGSGRQRAILIGPPDVRHAMLPESLSRAQVRNLMEPLVPWCDDQSAGFRS